VVTAGFGSTVVAADVLWSDPVLEPGLKTNDSRGIGLTFGPDVTEVSWRWRLQLSVGADLEPVVHAKQQAPWVETSGCRQLMQRHEGSNSHSHDGCMHLECPFSSFHSQGRFIGPLP
jgi:hypothetical protein